MVFIKEISFENILSFEKSTVGLQDLNIVVGTNGSGKSNFIDALNLLHCLPTPEKMMGKVIKTGGIMNWFYMRDHKRAIKFDYVATASDTLTLKNKNKDIHHIFAFTLDEVRHDVKIVDEKIEENLPRDLNEDDVFFYFRYNEGFPYIFNNNEKKRRLERTEYETSKSILAQKNDAYTYPVLSWLKDSLENDIRIYQGMYFSRNLDLPGQVMDTNNEFLNADASNLALVLNRLRLTQNWDKIEGYLKKFNPNIRSLETQINPNAGLMEIWIKEKNGMTIPFVRLSDGTVRFLCFLTIFCNDKMPKVICFEEPELGMHPDVIPLIAEIIKDASKLSQVIVSTHSVDLIERFSGSPECVLVVEKNTSTFFRRLNSDALKEWLKNYSLGQLWYKGVLGGVQ